MVENHLENRGFKRGLILVVDDLIKNVDIVPEKGILVGTVTFAKDKIMILSDQYVYANFGDEGIFTYTM